MTDLEQTTAATEDPAMRPRVTELASYDAVSAAAGLIGVQLAESPSHPELRQGLGAALYRTRGSDEPCGLDATALERASDAHAAIEARTTLGKTLLVVR
jgi:hypothetical protein